MADNKENKKENKDYCDAEDQKTVVDKMADGDKSAKTDKERADCYSEVVKKDDGCMS
nr:hypothetical protein [uncultured Desulfobacter sp.]